MRLIMFLLLAVGIVLFSTDVYAQGGRTVNLNTTVDSTYIKNDSIGNEDLVPNSVTTTEIRDSTIDSTDVKDVSLSVGDIANGNNGLVTKPTFDDSLANYGIRRTANTMMQLRGGVGVGDSLQTWLSSLGNTVASVDSVGNAKFGSLSTTGAGKFGSLNTQPTFSVTMSPTSDLTDSSFAIRLLDGVPRLTFYGTDKDSMHITVTTGDQLSFLTASGGYTFDYPITANFKQKTYIVDADTTIGADQSGTLFICRPLTAKRTITLPTAAANLIYEFMVADTDSLLIASASGDSLITSAGAAWKTTSSVAGTVKLVAIDTVRWIMQYTLGTWTSY